MGSLDAGSVRFDTVARTRTWSCKGISGGNAQSCSVACADGTIMVNNAGTASCQTPVCTGTMPQHAVAHPSAGEEDKPTQFLPRNYSATDTARKCEFKCSDGYTWDPATTTCKVTQYTVTTESNNTAWGTTSPLTKTLNPGKSLTVTAKPTAPHKFKHWIDKASNNVVSTNPSYTFTVTKNISLQAVFEAMLPPTPPVEQGVKWECRATENYQCTRQDGVRGAQNACAGVEIRYCDGF